MRTVQMSIWAALRLVRASLRAGDVENAKRILDEILNQEEHPCDKHSKA